MECLKIGEPMSQIGDSGRLPCRLVKSNSMDRGLERFRNTFTSNATVSANGYVRETDQGNLVVNDDVEGGGFEIG